MNILAISARCSLWINNVVTALIMAAGLMIPLPAHAVTLQIGTSTMNLMNDITIHEDPSGHQSFNDILKLPANKFLQPKESLGNAINLGFTQSSHWIKLTLQRSSQAPKDWILEIPYLGLDQIDFYAPGREPIITGASRSLESRALFNRYYIFPIEVSTTPENYYFRLQSSYALTIPLEIYERQNFAEATQKTLIAQFLYFGGVLALVMYNLQLYLSLRDKSYLLYSIFGFFMGLGIFAGNGFGKILLWPDWSLWDQVSQSVLISIGAAFNVLFCRTFLQTQRLMPRWDMSLKLLATAYLIISAGLLYGAYNGAQLQAWYKALMLLTAPYFFLVTIVTIKAWRNGRESAKFFLLSWFFLCVGAVIGTLRAVDWVPTNVFTAYAIQIGTGFEMLFLSYALAHRIQLERAKRETAQLDALAFKNKMVETLQASEEQLESLVTDRTRRLEASLTNEKKLHQQYVRFSAMISHEFRNPLNNIQAQADLLIREKKACIDQTDKRLGIITAAVQQLSLLFDRWLQSDRINNELALRNLQMINANLWIENLVDRFKAPIYNHAVYFESADGDTTLEVDEALLQIALINLLDNACKYSEDNQPIKVRIIGNNQYLGIEISDKGEGIDPSHHASIFEESFRVSHNHSSRGAGLGLAFVKKILELHRGEIIVNSTLGQGATFTLWFPRQQSSVDY